MREKLLTLAVLSTLLGGCGVNLTAKRIDERALKRADESPGLIYTLPRTRLYIQQPITIIKQVGGVLTPYWAGCKAALLLGHTPGQRPAEGEEDPCWVDPSAAITVTYGEAEVTSQAEPDPTHRYSIDATPELFQMLSLKLGLGPDGVVGSINGETKDQSEEVVTKLAKVAVQVATSGSSPAASAVAAAAPKAAASAAAPSQGSEVAVKGNKLQINLAAAPAAQPKAASLPARQPDCAAASARALAFAKTAGALTRSLMEDIEACLGAATREVDNQREALIKLAERAVGTATSAATLEAVLTQASKRVAAAESARDALLVRFALDPSTRKTARYGLLFEAGLPERSRTRLAFTLAQRFEAGKVTVTGEEGEVAAFAADLAKELRTSTREFVIDVSCEHSCGDAKEPVTAGYRYRVPARSVVTLTQFSGKDGVQKSAQTMLIEQHGAIAALPERFLAREGKIGINFWQGSGALKDATIGATPYANTAVTDTIDLLKGNYDARKKAVAAEAAAARAAAAVDGELEAARRAARLAYYRCIADPAITSKTACGSLPQ
jgi:hypothetical protein